MKRIFMAVMLGTVFLPAAVFAHDGFYRDRYGWRDRFDQRIARPSEPRSYCHRHHRDGRLHCHYYYNDPHRLGAERSYAYPWWRR